MKARQIVILLCILALFLAMMACIKIDDNGGGWTPTQGSPSDPFDATATYGAEQFHIQLTAQANPEE